MGKFQIFQDGRAAGSAPVSGSDFVTKDYLSGSLVPSPWVVGEGSGSAKLQQPGVLLSNVARGKNSVAHGDNASATGESSHAEGSTCFAQGTRSHAEGYNTLASGSGTHTEGYQAKAYGIYSHAEGYNTIAKGRGAHAEGSESIASGSYSHAEGYQTLASGSFSHAEGYRTTASNDYELAVGRNNATASGQIFSVGTGFYMNGVNRNAISVITSSNNFGSASIFIQGVGGYKGNNPVEGTNDIATVIAKLTGSIASASYSSTDKKIYFYNTKGTASCNIDATDFIKDGMVDSVAVSGSYLVLTFNTDAGKEPVSMSLTQIFNPDNYYTKSDVDTLLTTMSVGDVNVIEAVEFNGTASSISNKTASINVEIPEGALIVRPIWSASSYSEASDSSSYRFAPGTYQSALDAYQAGRPVYLILGPNHEEGLVANCSESILKLKTVGEYGGDFLEFASEIGYFNSEYTNAFEACTLHNGEAGDWFVNPVLSPWDIEPLESASNWVAANSASIPTESIWIRGTGSGSAILSGSNSEATGQFSIAEGYQTITLGEYSHAEGARTTASGDYSHAEGWNTTASADYAHAEGYRTVASQLHSHAEGYRTTASGISSHAEGQFTVASGGYSHAEGYGAKAMGECSHAEGSFTSASGISSHAEGVKTTASADYAHTEGSRSLASGLYSHAEGAHAQATASGSHAEGQGTIASNNYEHAQGRCNATASSQIFSVGVGSNDAARKNAVSIITGSGTVPSASIYVYGVGTYDGTNPTPGVNDLAAVIASITGSQGGNTPLVIDVSSASWTDGGSGSGIVSENADGYFTVDPNLWNQAAEALKNNRDVYLYRWNIYGSDGNGFLYRASRFFSGSIPGFINFDVCYDSNVGAIKLIQFDPNGNIFFKTTNYVEESEDFWRSFTWGPGEGSGSAVLTDWYGEIPATATGQFAVAQGYAVQASGAYSHAEGYYTLASGTYSHAEGSSTRAIGSSSHAEGIGTVASGESSHAEGSGSVASGSWSHAEGRETKAVGSYSHVEGWASEASGEGSHAAGYGVYATNPFEFSVGRPNFTSSRQIFSVGVGSPRAFGPGVNAISVITGSNPSASIYIYGVGSYNGTNPQPGYNDIASVIKQISASIGSGSGITSESDPIYLADSASLKNAATWVGGNSASLAASVTALNSISASLIASGTLAKNVTAITASLIASASVAKTASSSAAALSAKSASWDALVGLPAVTAADNGKILRVVNGAWALVDPVTVYSGQGAPDSALGQDGDIYLQS